MRLSTLLTWPFVAAIRLYQRTLGLFLPDRCRFAPSCSAYAVQTLRLNGILGIGPAVWRLLRCGPWTAGGIDEPRKLHLHRPSQAKTGKQVHHG